MATLPSSVEDAGDAITAEEITNDAIPNEPQPSVEPASQKRPNACMSA